MDHLWLGSLASYRKHQQSMEAVNAAVLAGTLSYQDDNDEDDSQEPDNFTLFGNVGVIDVTGALTNDDSWWVRYSGDTSYNQIRRALFEAYNNPNTLCGLINFDTQGGTPNGLSDVGDLIRQMSANGFPIYGYSGGTVASAGYWLASATDKLYVGETTTVGSIGVISVHKEITQMLKQQGITANVFRAGEKKALGNPYEKLTPEARTKIQTQIEDLYDVFINRVAQYRGVAPEYVREHMADGAEFIGAKALAAGLVDGVTTLDNLIATLQSNIDKKRNGMEADMAKKTTTTPTWTQAQQAALLEGIDPATLSAEATAAPETETPDPALQAETTLAEAQTPDPALSTETAGNPLIAYLQTELAAANQKLADQNIQLSNMTTKLTTLESVHEQMRTVVANSVARMGVCLGAPLMDVGTLPAEALLIQHASLSAAVQKKFPVGGIAAIPVDDGANMATNVPDPLAQARLRQAQM